MATDLSAIKVGDKLYTNNKEGLWGDSRKVPYTAWIVERLTTKQVIAKNLRGNEVRFWIENGRMVGGSYGDYSIIPTPEMVAEQATAVRVRNAQDKVKAKINEASKLGGKRDQNDGFWLMLNEAIEAFELKEEV